MPLPILEKILGRSDARPAEQLEKRLENLLHSIEKPRIAHPAKFWIAKEVQRALSPLLITIPLEEKDEFAVIWAQNRKPSGIMLFARSQWPNVDYDLWAYTRSEHRGQNIAKFTLVEGLRQLALQSREVVLTAEILIENERTRAGAVRWLKVLGFIASETETTYKSLFMAAYPRRILQDALLSLPQEYQKPEKKMPPLPPDILTQFTEKLRNSFNQGGKDLLNRRRTTP